MRGDSDEGGLCPQGAHPMLAKQTHTQVISLERESVRTDAHMKRALPGPLAPHSCGGQRSFGVKLRARCQAACSVPTCPDGPCSVAISKPAKPPGQPEARQASATQAPVPSPSLPSAPNVRPTSRGLLALLLPGATFLSPLCLLVTFQV